VAEKALAGADQAGGPMHWLWHALYRTGDAVWGAVVVLLDLMYLLANALGGAVALRTPYFWRSLTQQLYFTAVQVFWLANLIGLALGVLAVLPLLSFGLSSAAMQATVMRVVLFHQLVPLMIALVVIGRSGTAITSELGDMQSKGVVDSMLLMGIEPHHFLVLPRLLGMVISLQLLTLWANLAAIAGGALFNALRGAVGARHFVDACLGAVEPFAVLQSALMVLAYALAIGLVHCYYGLQSQTSTDVQRNLALAFVRSLIACVAITVLFGVAGK
jgi:phospholipid/cholesterol/gamma-HCH transport system permease protein